LRPVLVPFVLALFFTYCLAPVIDLQMRWFRVPRGAAIVGAGICGLAVATLLGLAVAASVSAMTRELGTYRERFHALDQRIAGSPLMHRFGVQSDSVTGETTLLNIPENATNATFTLITAVVSETTTVLAYAALVVVFMIFILLGRAETRRPPSGLLAEIES